ncbi:MAG: class I SAM-dependent methyltransferase [Thaumarchaeota archaeon]|nr:class I SAM-dependent methyltransferase [Nitrososphaerota archaeon]
MKTVDPFVPIPEDVIPVMLRLASLKPDEKLVDLGSGDGRILVVAARDFGAKATGAEVRRDLVLSSRKLIRSLGLAGRAKVVRRRFRDVSLRSADVVALYLSGYALTLLKPKFRRELKDGARVVTFYFEVPGWKPESEVMVKPKGWRKEHPMYLYLRKKPA